MRSILKKIILVCVFLVGLISFSRLIYGHKPSSGENYRILFISSYSQSWEAVPYQIEGIRQSLDPNIYTIDFEFMDTKNTKYSEGYREYYQLLKYKLNTRPSYDGIIVGDDAALRFVQLYREDIFHKRPIVFHGIDDIENGILASEDPLITGIVERVDYAKNLELAKKILPQAENLVLLIDDLESGIGIKKQLEEDTNIFNDYNVEYINSSDFTRKELCDKFERYSRDHIVFVMVMGEEKGGILYTDEDAEYIFREHTKTPIFRATYAGIGNGVFGGYIIDHEACARIAGQMMIKMLKENIVPQVVLDTPSKYFFDYNIMDKYKINISQVPSDSHILNKPEGFIEKNSEMIINFLLLGTVILMIGLYYNNKTKNQLQAANMKLFQIQEDLKHQASHDHLTDLPNRRSIMLELERLLFENIEHTVIIIDIDDFKEINDAYGNVNGDIVLKTLSKRLLKLREDDISISRFGGDEFLALLKGKKQGEVNKVIFNIKKAFILPIRLEGLSLYIEVSMGISTWASISGEKLDILSNANLALQEAKEMGKNSIVFYDNIMRDRFIEKKEIEEILNRACDGDGFKLLYQPQVDIGGNISGYEALLRLKDEDISPGKFIAIAEETDLILKVGRIVTKKVIEQMVKWRDKGVELKPVSINFSNRQIRDEGYVSYLLNLLEINSISVDLIEIEITENILVNNDIRVRNLFDKFITANISLALDDFGTGYSSISYLSYIPVKKVKIDRIIVKTYLNDEKEGFIKNLIGLSHSLGLKITIEGVETKEQYERLIKLKCDYIQGYYFSRPIEGYDVEKLKSPIVP